MFDSPISQPGPNGIARPPRLPFAVRAVNRLAGALRATGLPLARLDEASLLGEARRNTGLSDLGEGPFLEPLRLLIDSLEQEARLTWLGRSIARRELVRVIGNRLRLVEDRRAHPEIAAETIRRPLFVVGLPRTGSTILHDLLAQDPANRVPLTWECMWPSPPPERDRYETDPRIAECDAQFPGVDKLIPGFKAMHPMGARLAQECVALFQHSLATPIFHNEYRVPRYEDWVDSCDWGPHYEFHRRQLQHLQWRCPGERWVLKSGVHMWGLEHMLATYPDARVIQTHRDPVKVATSFASLATLVRSMGSSGVNAAEVAADWAPRLAKALHHAIDVRDGSDHPEARFHDLQFRAFVKDPFAAVEGIYADFELELSGEAADRMRAFIAANPQGKHGVHSYRASEYGLDPGVERQRFARYIERFGIEIEPEGAARDAKVRDL
jgi:cytochrome c5